MTYPFFAYIARMRYIGRWGLMRNTEPENIQEHSHMVAVLAHALAVIRRARFGGTVDPGRSWRRPARRRYWRFHRCSPACPW